MKRILSLDGGGVRGALSAGFLLELERKLADRHPTGTEGLLAEHFDLVAGTSTGSIIATAVCLGYTAAQIRDLYVDVCPRVFTKPRLLPVKPRFDAGRLEDALKAHLGDETLESDKLRTGILICAKRIDTGSAWFLTNNPNSMFWNGDPETGAVPNRNFKIVDVVRASAAAPFFFDAAPINIEPGRPPGLFVDGGVSPYNCPALAAFLVATLAPYGNGWPTGADNLSILSIGTGGTRPCVTTPAYLKWPAFWQAKHALETLIFDTQVQAVTLLQALSESKRPVWINRELESMEGICITPEPVLDFLRLEAPLNPTWLKENADISVTQDDANRLLDIANPGNVAELLSIGEEVAKRTLRSEDLV